MNSYKKNAEKFNFKMYNWDKQYILQMNNYHAYISKIDKTNLAYIPQ